MQISLTRASSLMNESNRSHAETPGRDHTKNADNKTILPLTTCLSRIQKSTDMMAAEAEKLFYDCEYKKCYKILQE